MSPAHILLFKDMEDTVHLYKSALLVIGVHLCLGSVLVDPSLCGYNICCSNYIFDGNRCIECPAGTYGVNCSEACPEGYYGRLCKDICPLQCDQTCDVISGECPECTPGKYGVNCSEGCPDGFFGQLCEKKCPSECNETCDKISGDCPEKICECHLMNHSTNMDDLAVQKIQLEIEYLQLKIKKLKGKN